jgi:hypothetical protein
MPLACVVNRGRAWKDEQRALSFLVPWLGAFCAGPCRLLVAFRRREDRDVDARVDRGSIKAIRSIGGKRKGPRCGSAGPCMYKLRLSIQGGVCRVALFALDVSDVLF